jgi:acyl-CoA thioesterase YciA
VATVAVDGMSFLKPVFVGDEVTIYAHVIGTGRTSMRIFVEAWRRSRHDLHSQKVTEATFVFVAIDEQRRPVALPDEPQAC